jgi:hypothetical protein
MRTWQKHRERRGPPTPRELDDLDEFITVMEARGHHTVEAHITFVRALLAEVRALRARLAAVHPP